MMNEFKFKISSLLNTISTLNFEELSEAFVCLKDVVSDIQKTLEQKTEQRELSRSVQCPKCSRIYESKSKLYEHLKSYFDTPLTCKLCKTSFNNRVVYDYHKKEKFCRNIDIPFGSGVSDNLKKYNCQHCEESFISKKTFQLHTLQNHATKVENGGYLCNVCEKLFNQKRLFFRHYRKCHHRENNAKFNVTDSLDGRTDQSSSKLKEQTDHDEVGQDNEQYEMNEEEHVAERLSKTDGMFPDDDQSADDDRPKFQCAHCDKYFHKKNLLSNHLKCHFNQKEYACMPCKRMFFQYRYYKRHVKSFTHRNNCEDGSGVLVKCDFCNKTYPHREALAIHVRTLHAKSNDARKRLSCHLCNFETNFTNSLNRHIAFHNTTSRQFVCDECGYCFHTSSALRDHKIYLHTTERNYSCEKCGQTFKLKSGLNRHFKTHSDERNQICFCGQVYKLATNLRKHQILAHGKVANKTRIRKLLEEGDGYLINSPQLTKSSTSKMAKRPPTTKSEVATRVNSDDGRSERGKNNSRIGDITCSSVTTNAGNTSCPMIEMKAIDDLGIKPINVLASVDMSCTNELLHNASVYNFPAFSEHSFSSSSLKESNIINNNDSNDSLMTPVHFVDTVLQPSSNNNNNNGDNFNTVISSVNDLHNEQQQHCVPNDMMDNNKISYSQPLCNVPYLQHLPMEVHGDNLSNEVPSYLIQDSLEVLNM